MTEKPELPDFGGVPGRECLGTIDELGRIATRQRGVQEAWAFEMPGGHHSPKCAEIIIAPTQEFDLEVCVAALRDILEDHAPLGTTVQVFEAQLLPINLVVTVRISSDRYDRRLALNAIKTALFSAFCLGRRKPGQSLCLSDVYQVVSSVQGVDNAVCILNGDADQECKPAARRQVLFLDPVRSVVAVRSVEP